MTDVWLVITSYLKFEELIRPYKAVLEVKKDVDSIGGVENHSAE
jgi:hypothetical protein